MLQTIQIIALLQGIFLLIVLISRRHDYKKTIFGLLVGTIGSVTLYALGDDDFNLFFEETNWFVFHDILIITFFFLLTKYYRSKQPDFDWRDVFFFIPYLVYVIFQLVEKPLEFEGTPLHVFAIVLLSAIILFYLFSILRRVYEMKSLRWMLFFFVPYTLIYVAERTADIIYNDHDSIPFLESYGVIGLSALLFYVILYKLIMTPTMVIEKSKQAKYKTSNLNADNIGQYKARLLELLEVEKIYMNKKISVHEVAKQMNIPRQYLSELLNVHMDTSFQELINKYRVEAFIRCLQMEKYDNYSLLGIANEMGFSSKTSFYTTFKKIKGVTPNQYKSQLDK